VRVRQGSDAIGTTERHKTMSPNLGRLISDPHSVAAISKDTELCGVWMGHGFCWNPIFRWRRCEAHFAALKRDDLYRSIRAMSVEQRERALEVLDDLQKRRPGWEYENPQGEAALIVEQETKS
jgi:hypothetical protein